jgi:23S rRNA (uracil1939-C5)-methyltransferase
MMNKQCPVEKNKVYDLDIVSLGSNGEGIGRVDGYTLFVPGALPGDSIKVKVVKTKKTYGYGIIADILLPSPNRIEAKCPVAHKCGGCDLQHLAYNAQLEYKQSLIKESLVRIGQLDSDFVTRIMEPLIGAEETYFYRNKVQYPVREEHGVIRIGFYAKNTHRIVETECCYIQNPFNEVIVKELREFMIEHRIPAYNEETTKGLVRHLVIRRSYHYDRYQVTLVINGTKLPQQAELEKRLQALEKVESFSININQEPNNVILGKTLITSFGPKYLVDKINHIEYHISPLSFYQVNPKQTEKLYAKALEYAGLTGNETVLDLYCGIGTISLFLGQQAKEVIGVEIVEAAILDAKQNAEINKATNVHFYVGKAEDIVPDLYKNNGLRADVVVVDPPRKGCEESLLETIVQISPQTIVYVSCDPGTLARDVKYLVENGYSVEKVCGVDMFSHTVHVETICLLQKI